MMYSCRYCGRMHPVGYDCPMKPHTKQDTQANKFRATKAWHKKAAEIKERDHYLCQVCMQEGTLNYKSLEVHHIEPLRERFDLSLEDGNLITLCHKHHTDAERGKIKRKYLSELASPRGEN
jgi:5-methylcytosine-specific restriction enzyme A